jgi:hypothetical protein
MYKKNILRCNCATLQVVVWDRFVPPPGSQLVPEAMHAPAAGDPNGRTTSGGTCVNHLLHTDRYNSAQVPRHVVRAGRPAARRPRQGCARTRCPRKGQRREGPRFAETRRLLQYVDHVHCSGGRCWSHTSSTTDGHVDR